MADDFDVEDMLEAPFRKDEGEVAGKSNNDNENSPDADRKKRHKKHKHRSRSHSKSRSPKRRRRQSDSRERRRSHRRRSHSRSPRRRSKSPRRHRSHSRSPRKRSRSPRRSPIRPLPPPQRRRGFSPPQSGMSMSFGRRRRSPDPDPPSEDRDRRTVMCMQLSQRVGPKDLEEFFQQVGQVREVKMIADKNSRRSKGIAYVEFHDEKSMTPAINMSGQKLVGIPIIVQPTMAEKNRLAALAQNLKKAEGPKKLYVGSLHYNITDAMLKAIFEPFGHVERLAIQKDEGGHSKGFGFVEFKDSESCERAMTNLNGFELAGRPMKINNVTERDMSGTAAMDMLDGEDSDVGVGMTPHSRAALMAKLAEGHNAGLSVPQVPQVPPMNNNTPAISTCFMLSNMFEVSIDNEPGWEQDIRDDVLEECNRFGAVLHVYVDSFSQGNVYVKCINSQVAAAAFNNLNGRFFAGKKIVAQFIAETTYHVKFPVAATSLTPLKPSA